MVKILLGASVGRSGTTQMSMHCQKAGAAVTHERCNPYSPHWNGELRDKFTLFSKPKQVKEKFVDKLLENITRESAGSSIVGDISHTHSQYMDEALKNPNVILLAQTRQPESYATSCISFGRTSRAETMLLRSRGITAKTGSRKERLMAYQTHFQKEVSKLQRRYGKKRVIIQPLEDLSKKGPEILKSIGLKVKWDAQLGKNASSDSTRYQDRAAMKAMRATRAKK